MKTSVVPGEQGLEAEGNPSPVSNWDIFVLCCSLGLYIYDICSDVIVAFDLETGYKISILAIVLVQAILCNIMSWIWYKDSTQKFHRWERAMHLLPAPVLRYIKALYYACKARRTNANNGQNYVQLYRESMEDLALLGISEGFLEAGPQLVVQIGYWIRSTTCEELTMPTVNLSLSMIGSIISLAFAMQNYHQVLRLVEEGTRNVSYKGRIMIFLWHLLFESSRIIVLVCMMVMNPLYMLFWILHLVGIYIWLQFYGPDKINLSKFYRQLLLLWLSLVFLFNAIAVRKGSTRSLYALIYSIFAIEGIIVFVTWFYVIHWKKFTFLLPTISIVCFCLGLAFMVIYYKCFHPVNSHHNSMEMNGCKEHQSDKATYVRVSNDNNEVAHAN